MTADVTEEAAIAAVLAAVPALDGVVHAAGVAVRRPGSTSPECAEWERVIAINLTGTFLVAKVVLAGHHRLVAG